MQGSKLYVGNLKYSVNTDELRDLFSNHGEVKDCTVIEGKGFGFIEMSSVSEAEAAMTALNGTDFDGRTLRIDEARPRRSRDDRPQGGGGRGRY